MKRYLYKELREWKASKRRKPLLLQGARQVGKTWLISEFGNNEYDDFIYLNFEQNPSLRNLFLDTLQPTQIIENIALYIGRKIESSGTLVCFDEIQTAPEVLTSLKYFYEQAPDFHIIAAGSLLGVQVNKSTSFPVGKVSFLTLYPLSFSEYMEASGESLLIQRLHNVESGDEVLPDVLHEKVLRFLKLFLFLGGMPEVVQYYLDHKDIEEARNIQLEIVESYQRDFSKYTLASDAVKLSELWRSIPYQLAKENKKFKYSDVRKKSRASMFEQSIEWLRSAGLIHVTNHIRSPKLPLIGYADYTKFKVYVLDTGLLGAMLKISSKTILEPGKLFSEYNGAFTENYVATEFVKNGFGELFYWTSNSAAEVDFVLQINQSVIPFEVKSGLNKKTKSLKSYVDKYTPALQFRISPRNYIQSGKFINLPLYQLFALNKIISEYK